MKLDSDAYLGDRERIASNVRAEVARKGVPQSALASALEMNQAGVSRRLSGRIDFSATELAVLARLLQVSVAAFYSAPALAEGGDAA